MKIPLDMRRAGQYPRPTDRPKGIRSQKVRAFKRQAAHICLALAFSLMALASAPFPALAATGYINQIAGSSGPPLPLDLASPHSASIDSIGAGWEWDEATDTLTLDNGYSGSNNPINITADPGDTIILELAGDVTITSATGGTGGIWVSNGGLAVKAGAYKLTINSNEIAIFADGDIAISSGTVDATSSLGIAAIFSSAGNITVEGSSDVTASASLGAGITALLGNVGISTSGTVTAAGSDGGIIASDSVTIASGTVTASATQNAGIFARNSIDISGGTVDASGGNAARGYALYAGDSTVDPPVIGDVNISGGTVTTHAGAAGDIYGTLSHTGGYLNGLDENGNPPPTPGGGGCDTGFGAGALLAAMALVAAGKKRRGR
jgi:Synergist-CTERM protein sorting domain-containing protein